MFENEDVNEPGICWGEGIPVATVAAATAALDDVLGGICCLAAAVGD